MAAQLDGKIALVTGATGGIGTAICDRFAREGAVVYATDRNAGPLANGAEFVAMDVTDEQRIMEVMSRIAEKHGRLDVLVNAAGIEIEETIEDTSLEVWNEIFAINVTGTFLVSKHALPMLRLSGGASVINFGSYDGFIADPKLAAYCATKGAVHALTRAMACDHGPEGIRVNAICPGYVNTPMMQSFLGDAGDVNTAREEIERVHPVRRMGEPEDIANLVNWLATDEARYASGQLWVIDGGLSAQVQQMRL